VLAEERLASLQPTPNGFDVRDASDPRHPDSLAEASRGQPTRSERREVRPAIQEFPLCRVPRYAELRSRWFLSDSTDAGQRCCCGVGDFA
jgi:hypothetical protein